MKNANCHQPQPHLSGRRVSGQSYPREAQRRRSRLEARRRRATRRGWPCRPAAWWGTTEERDRHKHRDRRQVSPVGSQVSRMSILQESAALTSVTMESTFSVKVTCWLTGTPSCWCCCSMRYSGVNPTRTMSMDWQAMYTWTKETHSLGSSQADFS